MLKYNGQVEMHSVGAVKVEMHSVGAFYESVFKYSKFPCKLCHSQLYNFVVG